MRRAMSRSRRVLVLGRLTALVVLSVGASGGHAWAASGDPLWARRHNGPADGADYPNAVASSPDGSRVFVTGSSTGPAGADLQTVAYDALTGATAWSKRFDGSAGGADLANAIATSPDGSMVFVTGSTQVGASDTNYVTIAYRADTGARTWMRRLDGPGSSGSSSDTALAITVSSDGASVAVTGQTEGVSAGDGVETVVYAAATGAERWAKRFDTPGPDQGNSLVVSPDSRIAYVSGSAFNTSTGKTDYIVLTYDVATGAEFWMRRYNGPDGGSSAASDIALSPDAKRVVVTGGINYETSDPTLVTVEYDAISGAQAWARHYDGPGNALDDGKAVTFDPTGAKVIMTGRSTGAGTDSDYITIAYDVSRGQTLWMRRYDGPSSGYDVATSIGTSPDGSRVFVTGHSSAANPDFATIAYDLASGGKVWAKRYDGPAHADDSQVSLSVSPDGTRLFVTGASTGVATDFDFATVAYGT